MVLTDDGSTPVVDANWVVSPTITTTVTLKFNSRIRTARATRPTAKVGTDSPSSKLEDLSNKAQELGDKAQELRYDETWATPRRSGRHGDRCLERPTKTAFWVHRETSGRAEGLQLLGRMVG